MSQPYLLGGNQAAVSGRGEEYDTSLVEEVSQKRLKLVAGGALLPRVAPQRQQPADLLPDELHPGVLR